MASRRGSRFSLSRWSHTYEGMVNTNWTHFVLEGIRKRTQHLKAEGRYERIWGELGKGVRGRYDQNLLHEILKKKKNIIRRQTDLSHMSS